MNVNRGKKFEELVYEQMKKVPGVNVIRLHDQTTGYAGSKNPCDFVVYKYPYHYAIECKSVHGNTFPFSNITDFQYSELLRMSKIKGVIAGILVWWVDKDTTKFIPIEVIEMFKEQDMKSVRWDSYISGSIIFIPGTKKRVFFEYNFEEFFAEVENGI